MGEAASEFSGTPALAPAPAPAADDEWHYLHRHFELGLPPDFEPVLIAWHNTISDRTGVGEGRYTPAGWRDDSPELLEGPRFVVYAWRPMPAAPPRPPL